MAEREWILLNPGPANTTAAVRQALVMPDLCHREPEFFEMMRSCRDRLVRLVCGCGSASRGRPTDEASGEMARKDASRGRSTDEASGEMARHWTAVLFTGSGTAAVEAALASAVPPDGGVLVVNNGVYGERMIRICRAHNIRHHAITSDNVTPVAPAEGARVLREQRGLSHVAVVHHETTTGLLNPVAEVARAAAAEGRRVIVDAMSSLFGEALDVTADGIDFVTASANKCLQGVPGVSFVIARRSAVEALRGRAPRSVYLDLYNHYVQQEADNTPFMPAVQVMHAMEQALIEHEAEGVANRIARYAESCRVLRQGMAELGFEILVPDGVRSNILTTFRLPGGVSYDGLHEAMKRRGCVIYAGQGDIRTYAFRVSNMGTLTPLDMKAVVDAFASSLEEIGAAAAPRRG